MTEYCLLWIQWWATCLNKTEWAAWAQAAGVFSATLLALILPLVETRRSRREKKREYINERFALNEFKNDVIHFVGPMTNSSKLGEDLKIDDVQYGRVLERISYFDVRLRDASGRRLLGLIRELLRSVDSYRQRVNNRELGHNNLLRNFQRLGYSKFNPEDESFFYVRGETPAPDKGTEAEHIGWFQALLLTARSRFRVFRKTQ